MSEHSRLAPSSAGKWGRCAQYVSIAAQFPTDPDSKDDGVEGTAAHWFASEIIQGRQPVVAPNGILLTEQMRDFLQVYVDVVPKGAYLETRVTAADVHVEAWGTCDAFEIDYVNRVIRVWDLKYGWGIVEVFENPQLVIYAAGVHALTDATASWKFELHIVQPRPWHRDGAVRAWHLSYAELTQHVRHLRAQAEEALGNNPSAQVGAYCKHCEGAHACAALRQAGLDAADKVETRTPEVLPLSALSHELTALRRAASALESRLAGLEAQATAEIRQGRDVPGWSLEATKGNLKWSVPAEEVFNLGTLTGVSLAKPLAPITPAQAKKAGVPDDLIAKYAARENGEAKLVPVNTSRARAAFGG